jgi:hypothetical protein
MSSAMPGRDLMTRFITGAITNIRVSGASDGFTRTSPVTASPLVSASRSARQAPIESPNTNTCDTRAVSSSNARDTSPYQSVQPVRLRSCQVVP